MSGMKVEESGCWDWDCAKALEQRRMLRLRLGMGLGVGVGIGIGGAGGRAGFGIWDLVDGIWWRCSRVGCCLHANPCAVKLHPLLHNAWG